jgi:GT2 family glycosyltransferase
VHSPAATIAIPCCNGEAHLVPLLESWLAQSCQDFELVIVDDASDDASVALVRRIAGARARIVVNSQRLGLAANFAKAASLVETPFFCIAHQDDDYAPEYLRTMLAALAERPSAAFAHCSATAIDSDGNAIAAAAERFKRRLAQRAVDAPRPELHRLLWRGNFVCCPSVLFRTEAYRRAGGFDPSLSFALDWDLWFRLIEVGFDIVTVLEPLMRYRRHLGNASRGATRSLSRFHEERAVLAKAEQSGRAAGLIEGPLPASRSLRNNLVNEAFEDLRAGHRAEFAAKLAFAQQFLPELRLDPGLIGLRCMSRLGSFGVGVLGFLRSVAVRTGLGT